MHLKSLELFGFKSFRDHTTLNFGPGITAVVGPNGAGKSNVADGIRWVLGEQSARSLRGDRMEDVIFHGTSEGEPAGLAEVSLTFSNTSRWLPTPYEEVTITRRIFRSGESEYRLNKTVVRRRDIVELFMGTGVGMSAYSLMEQGKMDQVLSSKPEERRAIFEEASGITKYKSQREEALRKLAQTEENLLRVDDVIAEVKRQLGSIQRQVERARRYQVAFERLKALEIREAQGELSRVEVGRQECERRLAERRAAEAAQVQALDAVRGRLEELRASWSNVEGRYEGLSGRRAAAQVAAETKTAEQALQRERLGECDARESDLAAEITQITEDLVMLADQVRQAEELLRGVAARKADRVHLLTAREAARLAVDQAIAQVGQDLERHKAGALELAAQGAALRSRAAAVGADLHRHHVRLERVQAEAAALQDEVRGIEQRLAQAVRDVESKQQRLAELNNQRAEQEAAWTGFEEELLGLHRTFGELDDRVKNIRARREFVAELHRRYEGFSSGVRALLQDRDAGRLQLAGVHDVVANLLTVTPGYEHAVEAALGPYVEAVVMGTAAEAEAAAQVLKSTGIGRVTFLMVDHPPAGTAQRHPQAGAPVGTVPAGVLGPVSAFVTVRPEYSALCEALLGSTHVVAEVAAAWPVLRAAGGEGRVVTLDGDVVEGGLISARGGAADPAQSVLGREARMHHLEEEIATLEDEMEGVDTARQRTQEQLEATEAEIDRVKEDQRLDELGLADRLSVCETLEAQVERLAEDQRGLQAELDTLSRTVSEGATQQAAVTEALQDVEARERGVQDDLRACEQLLAEHARGREAVLVEAAALRAELGSVSSEEERTRRTTQVLASSLEERRQSLERRVAEQAAVRSRREALVVAHARLVEEVRELAGTAQTLAGDVAGLQEERLRVGQTIQEEERAAQRAQGEVDRVRAEVFECDTRQRELAFQQQAVRDRMRERYRAEVPMLAGAAIEAPVTAEEREHLGQLRTKLDAMGPVNLVALDEETELTSRYDFLMNQRQDLTDASQHLKEAIQKINRTTKGLFLDTFQAVDAAFQEFFRALFGGGEARVVLLEPEDVLETGIEIIARPPGKRAQQISLLSVGERALTAVALLFALFKVKPSPFCVLDELDAPLDESNIDRFRNLLGLFTETSQFIVITHNKRTIAMADVMYGITMEQSGVSTVVSVKFQDRKEEQPALASVASPG